MPCPIRRTPQSKLSLLQHSLSAHLISHLLTHSLHNSSTPFILFILDVPPDTFLSLAFIHSPSSLLVCWCFHFLFLHGILIFRVLYLQVMFLSLGNWCRIIRMILTWLVLQTASVSVFSLWAVRAVMCPLSRDFSLSSCCHLSFTHVLSQSTAHPHISNISILWLLVLRNSLQIFFFVTGSNRPQSRLPSVPAFP